MKITEIQIIPIKANNGLVAFGSLILDDNLYIGSIGIHKRRYENGYRITYPTKKIGDKDINIYHPINKEASKAIENALLGKMQDILE